MTLERFMRLHTDERGRPIQMQVQLIKKLGVKKQIRLWDLR